MPNLAIGLDAMGVHGEGVSVVQSLRGAEAVNASLIAVAHVVGAGDLGQVGRLVDQDVGLVGSVAGAGRGRELEPVVADDDVPVGAGLGVGNDAVAAEVADVSAVQTGSARRAAEEGGGLSEDAGDSALGARGGGAEVLLDAGAGSRGGLGRGGVALGLGEGGRDGGLLGASAVALNGHALLSETLVEGGLDGGGLDTVDLGLQNARVENDLADDLVAALLGVAKGAGARDVVVATAAQVVDLGGVPLDLDDLAGSDGAEGGVGEVSIVDVDTDAGEGNLVDC